MRLHWAIGTACLVFLNLCSAPLRASEVPFLAGRVNDLAGILSPEVVRDLERTLKAHEDSTSNQVVVLTVPSLEGESIEEFSIRVVDAWRLGVKGKDNGVLLLVAKGDRKVRIEVGRGLEGNLPDITCGAIIRNEILPRFKRGDYEGGTRAGIGAILAAIRGAYSPERKEGQRSPFWLSLMSLTIFVVVVGLFTINALISKGFLSWFLYVFLMPFWYGFPASMLGTNVGIVSLALFVIGFPVLKTQFREPTAAQKFLRRWGMASGAGRTGSSGGFFSGGSSGGGFSGGGGGFSGGGASGSW